MLSLDPDDLTAERVTVKAGHVPRGPEPDPDYKGLGKPDPGGLHAPPKPLAGGPLAFIRFARENHLLRIGYVELVARWLYLKLRYRGRFVTDGLCFIRRGVKFEIGPQARVEIGRWAWIGDGTKVRAHEGVLSIGSKSVLGQDCTLYCFQHLEIGRECIFADRTMLIDFEHKIGDVERSIRKQGIIKHDVQVGNNVWIGYAGRVLSGVTVGDNAVIGCSAVVTRDVPANAIVGGVPAQVIQMREAPETLRF